jgi:hypothetical protein
MLKKLLVVLVASAFTAGAFAQAPAKPADSAKSTEAAKPADKKAAKGEKKASKKKAKKEAKAAQKDAK